MNWNPFITKIHERVNDYLDLYKTEPDKEELWNIHCRLLEIETVIDLLRNQTTSRTEHKLRRKLSKLWYDISLTRNGVEKLNPLF